MRKLWIIVLTVVGVLILAAVGLYFYWPVLMRQWMHAQLSPDSRAHLEGFSTKPLHIPTSWQVVAPYDPEVTARLDSIVAQWPQHNPIPEGVGRITPDHHKILQKLNAGEMPTEEEWTSATQYLAAHEQWVAEVAQLAHLPAYSLDMHRQSAQNFALVNEAVRLMLLTAYTLAKQGNCDEALQKVVTTLNLAKRHPASPLIDHLIAIAVISNTSIVLHRLAAGCDNANALREALSSLNALDPQLNLGNLEQGHLLDVIGGLRAANRDGYRVDLSSGKPMIFYFQQWLDWNGASSGQPRQRLPGKHGATVELTIAETMWTVAIPNLTEATTRERVSKAKYDLARLAMAKRILEIETGAAPANLASIEQQFPELALADPFTSEPYRWSPDCETFYATGPDKQDDQMQVIYDSTNGTVSLGDVGMKVR